MNKQDVVAVVLGGPSAEAEVSRASGGAIAAALREKGYNVREVELVPDRLIPQLRSMKASVVFNAVHGKYGEDGRLQSILEAAGIPYTGSGVLASAVAMDKLVTKRLLQSAGISTPQWMAVNKREIHDLTALRKQILKQFGLPVVIKPTSQGSSIGVTIAREADAVTAALQISFQYSDNILAEKFIEGKEITGTIIQENGEAQALPLIWITPHSGAYDYHSKYTKGATDYHCPAPLDEEVALHMQHLALATYRVLGLSGVARMDMMLDENNQGYVLEANTIPGMTATSLVPKAAAAVGVSFPDLCEKILLSAK